VSEVRPALPHTRARRVTTGAAAWRAAAGLRPDDRLAVCLPGGLDIAVAIWACARGGFIFTGLPGTLTPAAGCRCTPGPGT
jgi:acyl-coenzyme A synthetase/AMP-(fatty) acid ligase